MGQINEKQSNLDEIIERSTNIIMDELNIDFEKPIITNLTDIQNCKLITKYKFH